MSETKPPDEEQVEPGFNEHDDFDFGEAEAEPQVKVSRQSAPIDRKKMLFVIFGIVALVIAIMGYKTFRARALKTTTTTMVASAPVVQPSPEMPAPTTTPIATPPTTTDNTHYSDIAAAFDTKEPEVKETKGAKESSIPDLQKTLFNPPTAKSEAKTKETPKEAPKEMPNADQLAELNNGLGKLNHQIDYILNQIKYLDSYTREVSDNLNRLNDSIGTMDHRLLALTSTTSNLSKDVGTVRSEVGQVKQVLKEDGLDINLAAISTKKGNSSANDRITVDEPEYAVHAVIPGRAWLKSSKGQIVTVAEGEKLDDYGKVLVIDAANGIVLTSSGIAFR